MEVVAASASYLARYLRPVFVIMKRCWFPWRSMCKHRLSTSRSKFTLSLVGDSRLWTRSLTCGRPNLRAMRRIWACLLVSVANHYTGVTLYTHDY
jgi:hypothetical protein